MTVPLDAGVIDAVAPDFPAVSKPSGFVHAMVEIDEAYDRLKLIEKAGWTTPGDHPDLVPAAEAGRVADLFRDAGALAYTRNKPADFGAKMTSAHEAAQGLEDLLLAIRSSSDKQQPDAAAKFSSQFKLLAASCKDCHARYRD